LEHGIAIFRPEKEIFEIAQTFPLNETWRRPTGHPILWKEAGQDWLLYGSPTPNVRVLANLKSVRDPSSYEAFTCLLPTGEVDRDANSQPVWRWQKLLSPMTSAQERDLIKAGKLKSEESRFHPANATNSGERIVLHSGSVRWNPYRRCWVMLAGEIGGTSFLGEVWYAEAASPTGPFAKAIKVVTHNNQSFYNVCHHDFLDRDGGRILHFEGTYTNEFSGNTHKTPRYNYNQILYRLDLDHEQIKSLRP
jgi:hypothetical protein